MDLNTEFDIAYRGYPAPDELIESSGVGIFANDEIKGAKGAAVKMLDDFVRPFFIITGCDKMVVLDSNGVIRLQRYYMSADSFERAAEAYDVMSIAGAFLAAKVRIINGLFIIGFRELGDVTNIDHNASLTPQVIQKMDS